MKLQQRTRGHISEPEIAKGLDDKDLTQLCVEINSGSMRESTKFAGRADLLQYNPVTPVSGGSWAPGPLMANGPYVYHS